MPKDRIVLAYAGGLDTSVAIPWLAERYDADVIAVTLDVGQPRELADVRERALAIGALRAHVLDVREEFAREYVLPALQAGAMYEHQYPLATALARPLIARHLVAVARMEGARAIAHGCSGTGNGQVRLEVSVRALDPRLEVIAPARLWGLTRSEQVEYARQRKIPVPPSARRPYSTDANMWGRSIECGVLEDPWSEPPEDIYVLTRAIAECPDAPAYVEIAIEQGVPTKINGIAMGLAELVASLDTIAGAHGVGRIDMIENRLVGIKSREIYEAPAAVLLHAAHREVEAMNLPRDVERVKRGLGHTYAELVYNGLWFTPLRGAIDAFVAHLQPRVTGVVRFRLFKGSSTVVGRSSALALYDHQLASDEARSPVDHRATDGFIRVWGLPVETAARRWNAAHGPEPSAPERT